LISCILFRFSSQFEVYTDFRSDNGIFPAPALWLRPLTTPRNTACNGKSWWQSCSLALARCISLSSVSLPISEYFSVISLNKNSIAVKKHGEPRVPGAQEVRSNGKQLRVPLNSEEKRRKNAAAKWKKQ